MIPRFVRYATPYAAALGTAAMALLFSCAPSQPAVAPAPHGTLTPEPVFGGSIHTWEIGDADAPLVVLLHGLGGSSEDFTEVAARLSPDFRLLGVDLPGFGRSSKHDTDYTPERYAVALEQLLHDRGPFHLVGHSMGGGVSMVLAAKHPHLVRRLVVIDAAGVLHGSVIAASMVGDLAPTMTQRNVIQGAVHQALGQRLLEPDDVLYSPLRRKLVLGSDPNRIAALGLGIYDFGPAMDRVRAPTLVLWGSEDRIAPLRAGEMIARRIRGARLHVLRGAGHVPMRSEPERTTDLIRRFLLGPAGRPDSPMTPELGTRSVRIEGEAGVVLAGAYDSIEIIGSSVSLREVTARKVHVRRSDVSMEGGVVSSEGVALRVAASRLQMTNVEIRAEVAIQASASRLDLANVTLIGTRAALLAKTRRASVVLSASRIRSPRNHRYAHETRNLLPGEML